MSRYIIEEAEDHKNGFTLIELSIVLVIVGLLMGGVVAGQELVNQTKRNKTFTDLRDYGSGVLLFKMKYKQYPGDMPNASTLIQGVTVGSNGDGDKIVEPASTGAYESNAVFHHLSYAKIIKGGSFTSAGGYVVGAGYQTPPSPYGATIGYLVATFGASQDFTFRGYMRKDGVGIRLGGFYSSVLTGSGISPNEAILIDTKFDDGNATKGLVASGNSAGTDEWTDNCVTAANPADMSPYASLAWRGRNATYNSNDSPDCLVLYWID